MWKKRPSWTDASEPRPDTTRTENRPILKVMEKMTPIKTMVGTLGITPPETNIAPENGWLEN